MHNTNTMKKTALILIAMIIGFAGLGLVGCKGKKAELSPEQTSSEEALFKAGEQALKKDAEKARLYLRQVIESFPKGFYAQRAKLAIADSYFDKGDEGNMIMAASEYREFISLFPYSPSAPYAQYRIAMTFYTKVLKAGRDQTKTAQALAEFRRVTSTYPLSDEAKQAQDKIKDCEERLAEHMLGIAKHYHRVRAYSAALSRLNEILSTYPAFSQMDEVFFYIGDSYLSWGKAEQSVAYFSKLITDYPKSKLVQDSQERLKAIEEAKRAAPKK